MFGRATITLGIGPHSSCIMHCVYFNKFSVPVTCGHVGVLADDSAIHYVLLVLCMTCFHIMGQTWMTGLESATQ